MQKLNDTALKNFTAFTKLYGYIKYFHPSDEAASIDWNKFAVMGMREVKKCRDNNSLKDTLNRLFLPIAPSLKIFSNGGPGEIDIKNIIPDDTTGLKTVAWQHLGVSNDYLNFCYKSTRINKPEYFYGAIGDYLPGFEYHGKKMKIKAVMKADVKNKNNFAGLFIVIDRTDGRKADFYNTFNSPITKNEWNVYELICDIDDKAYFIFAGICLYGRGSVWIDKLDVLAADGNEWKQVEIKHFDFEQQESEKQPNYLVYDEAGKYRYLITEKEKLKGTKSLEINCYPGQKELYKLYDEHPRVGEIITKNLNSDILCSFPIALYHNSNGTIPASEIELYNSLVKDIDSIKEESLTGNELAVRLAGICIAWNTLQHFYPYFDVIKTDWKSALTRFLTKAYNCKDEFEYHDVLKLLSAELEDGHSGAAYANSFKKKYPPLKTELAEGKAVISKITGDEYPGLKVGDIIIEIDDVNVEKRIKELARFISGATIQWKLYSIFKFQLLSGIKPEMKLLVEHSDGRREIVFVERNSGFENLDTDWFTGRQKGAGISEIRKGIVYVDLGISTMDQINEAMTLLEKAKGIIFDLRGYPNSNHEIIAHLIDSSVKSPIWNVPKIIYPDWDCFAGYSCDGIWNIEPKIPRLKGKIVFITGAGSISYAESFLGIIEYYKLAELVGEPTAGTNGNINHIYLPGNYGITFTGMQVLKPDGSRHHGIGIFPTVPVSKTIKGIRESRDEFLEKAIEIIKSN